jgi:hypothetical protein
MERLTSSQQKEFGINRLDQAGWLEKVSFLTNERLPKMRMFESLLLFAV